MRKNKWKTLSIADNGQQNFFFCRSADVTTLRFAEVAFIFPSVNQEVSGNYQLFKHKIARKVLYEFMRYSVPSLVCAENIYEAAEGTMHHLARLDAYVATAITFL